MNYPEDFLREFLNAQQAHENALWRAEWLQQARECVETGEKFQRRWNRAAMGFLIASIILGLLGIWMSLNAWPWTGILWSIPQIQMVKYAFDLRRDGRKAMQEWLEMRETRLNYADLYR